MRKFPDAVGDAAEALVRGLSGGMLEQGEEEQRGEERDEEGLEGAARNGGGCRHGQNWK